jgi:hypothetical protein
LNLSLPLLSTRRSIKLTARISPHLTALVTEAEAAQRWCPLVREVTPVGKGGKRDIALGNRYTTDKDDFTNPAGARCVGSVCMSWRWLSESRGHCGLAGATTCPPASLDTFLIECRRRGSTRHNLTCSTALPIAATAAPTHPLERLHRRSKCDVIRFFHRSPSKPLA